MKNKIITIFLSVFILVLSFAGLAAMAISEVAEQTISVKPILPENQKPGETGYFHMLVNSGDRQTLYMEITNNKEENITVALLPANAYTRPTGGIFYAEEIDSPETMIVDPFFALSDYLSMSREVRLKPLETIRVPASRGCHTGTVLM